ncbi:MAG: phosphoribosylaminoimidazolesuccinocarboxamide synthase [Candidatus Zixiibacteriota bacterium]|nr:MAG: phosphoribosylaminoimidazolesuccinocarboxamide synthase [candidate division Zixibacteria bacterium]
MGQVILKTDLAGIPLLHRGKVRDLYGLGDKLLVVATDRISAFDIVMPNGIPGKGEVLTAMSVFWFDYTGDIVENHLLEYRFEEYPAELKSFRETLQGRSMLVRKAKRIDVECVVRGYLAGTGWKDYKNSGGLEKKEVNLHGNVIPGGLKESEKLPRPIFTPSTKAETGHDENISLNEMTEMVGQDLTERIERISIRLYEKCASYAEKRGIIIADTKFEFGFVDDKLILIDELFSPDSSRFWPKDKYSPGSSQDSFDKQFVRDYLNEIGWDKKPPVPTLPADIVQKTAEKYREAFQRLVG